MVYESLDIVAASQESKAMTELHQNRTLEIERQQLVKQAHCLIAAIASRPGSTKLLQGVIPMLKIYASYKVNRARRRGSV